MSDDKKLSEEKRLMEMALALSFEQDRVAELEARAECAEAELAEAEMQLLHLSVCNQCGSDKKGTIQLCSECLATHSKGHGKGKCIAPETLAEELSQLHQKWKKRYDALVARVRENTDEIRTLYKRYLHDGNTSGMYHLKMVLEQLDRILEPDAEGQPPTPPPVDAEGDTDTITGQLIKGKSIKVTLPNEVVAILKIEGYDYSLGYTYGTLEEITPFKPSEPAEPAPLMTTGPKTGAELLTMADTIDARSPMAKLTGRVNKLSEGNIYLQGVVIGIDSRFDKLEARVKNLEGKHDEAVAAIYDDVEARLKNLEGPSPEDLIERVRVAETVEQGEAQVRVIERLKTLEKIWTQEDVDTLNSTLYDFEGRLKALEGKRDNVHKRLELAPGSDLSARVLTLETEYNDTVGGEEFIAVRKKVEKLETSVALLGKPLPDVQTGTASRDDALGKD